MKKIKADWLQGSEASAVFDALERDGAEVLAVGGCVRNHLLGHAVNDVDLATNAWPEHVMELAESAGLKAVPTGIEHGTVTVIAEGIVHEVTTYRADIETFGRHAKVRFSNDLREDAARRDFTMNALYARRDGSIVDPLGGYPDIERRHLRFIGSPRDRIAEDYLRILRFFRFTAWYGDPALGFDDAGYAECKSMAEGLDQLSKERIGVEMRKLLAAPDPAPAVVAMQEAGVLQRILPGTSASLIPRLIALESRMQEARSWLRRLAALGRQDATGDLRLSRNEARQLQAIFAVRARSEPLAIAAYREGADATRDALLLSCAESQQEIPGNFREEIERGAAAEFPVSAADLMNRFEPGPALGAELHRLEEIWLANDLRMDKAHLLKT